MQISQLNIHKLQNIPPCSMVRVWCCLYQHSHESFGVCFIRVILLSEQQQKICIFNNMHIYANYVTWSKIIYFLKVAVICLQMYQHSPVVRVSFVFLFFCFKMKNQNHEITIQYTCISFFHFKNWLFPDRNWCRKCAIKDSARGPCGPLFFNCIKYFCTRWDTCLTGHGGSFYVSRSFSSHKPGRPVSPTLLFCIRVRTLWWWTSTLMWG